VLLRSTIIETMHAGTDMIALQQSRMTLSCRTAPNSLAGSLQGGSPMKKRALFLLCTVIVFSISSYAQRLPELALPVSYALTFTPDFSSDTFKGEETLKLNVLKPTTQIVLNSLDIEFNEINITSGGETQAAKVSEDKQKQMVTLQVAKQLAPGPATLQIKYKGLLNDELRGFYIGHDELGNKYAVTQFESTDARRAFPSFDEPAYKATFDVTVVADKDLAVISNTKILADTPDASNNKHTVHFAATPKMSSYLLAIAVGHFESIEGSADGIPIRVWTTPGRKELGSFALESAEHILPYYDKYFGIKYPYGKLDLVGLPDFSAGAMENTACITFREVDLMLNSQRASLEAKKRVASVVAHEMAHQWFGDLVTMQWWDDVWLNEGFATWMSSKPLEAWHPEWHFEVDDVVESTQSINTDSLENTRPIHQEAETPDQIEELFDGIAYGKAAAVLRMLETYLGPDKFQAGVNAYLKKHSYANATASDFWTALAEASNKPVDKIMPTFVQQAGVPLVSIEAKCSGGTDKVDLEQQRYFYNRSMFTAKSQDQLWMIPVCLKAESKAGAKCELLSEREQHVSLKGCAPWIFANHGAYGYYRSGYTPTALRAISKNMEAKLTPAERVLLLADAWSSLQVGRITISDYLTFAEGFQHEHDSMVLAQFATPLEYLANNIVEAKDREAFNAWVRHVFGPTAREVGWDTKPGESDDQMLLRAQLMVILGGIAHDPQVQAKAKDLAVAALTQPGSVPSEMVMPAFAVAAMSGDQSLYDKVMARWKASQDPEQRSLYAQMLTRFTDPQLVGRTLNFLISRDVRSQDVALLLARELRNHEAQKQTWDFVQQHWQDIQNIGGAFSNGRIVQASAAFCSIGMRDSALNFFATHNTTSPRTQKQSLERMNDCIDLKSQQGSALTAWLEQHHENVGE
jgi:aminopeptidase N